jgi:hypothetical protein
MFDVDAAIKAANAVMKRDCYGVTIRRRGDRLYLRSTLPPKPDSKRQDAHQQEISLKVYANAAGLRFAKNESKRLSADLGGKMFDWKNWGWVAKLESRTVGDWLQAYEAWYFSENERNGKSETTWHTDYSLPILRLPQDEPLTESMMLREIKAKGKDTRSRKRFVDCYRRFARFAGLEVDFDRLKGKYKQSSVNHRDLPTDEQIRAWRDRIPDPAWQWYFGVIAAYGIRNHEPFHIDLDRIRKSPLIWVRDSKSGSHYALAIPPRWWEEWRLYEPILPDISFTRNSQYSTRTSQYFGRDLKTAIGERLPFGMQDLRHRWSIRASEMDVAPEFAAKLQAHSQKMHTDVYQRHTDEQTFLKVLKKLLSG